METNIYSLDFNPNILSTKQEELGLVFSDNDTAVELMKKRRENDYCRINAGTYS